MRKEITICKEGQEGGADRQLRGFARKPTKVDSLVRLFAVWGETLSSSLRVFAIRERRFGQAAVVAHRSRPRIWGVGEGDMHCHGLHRERRPFAAVVLRRRWTGKRTRAFCRILWRPRPFLGRRMSDVERPSVRLACIWTPEPACTGALGVGAFVGPGEALDLAVRADGRGCQVEVARDELALAREEARERPEVDGGGGRAGVGPW